MKIFIKNLETRQGVISANQAATEIKVRLYSDGQNPNEAFAQPAIVEISLYKDKPAIINGKQRLETKTFEIADVSQLQSYPALVQELIGLMINSENSPVYGATIDDTNET